MQYSVSESNPHPFYSFTGLNNQTRIRIAFGLDSRNNFFFSFKKSARASAKRFIHEVHMDII